MNTSVIWHYTTGDLFRKILEQQALLPDKSEPENPKEIPTVTFSTDPIWEKTRYRVGKLPTGRLVMMNKELLNEFCGGLIRIAVPASIAPIDWQEMKATLGLSQGVIQGLYNFAIEVGARTSHWFATTSTVPESEWIAVEKYVDGVWIALGEDDIPEVTSTTDADVWAPVPLPDLNTTCVVCDEPSGATLAT